MAQTLGPRQRGQQTYTIVNSDSGMVDPKYGDVPVVPTAPTAVVTPTPRPTPKPLYFEPPSKQFVQATPRPGNKPPVPGQWNDVTGKKSMGRGSAQGYGRGEPALIFPGDLVNSVNDDTNYAFMKLQIGNYRRDGVASIARIEPFRHIYLPIPNNLMDQQSVGYQTSTIDPLTAAAVGAVQSVAGTSVTNKESLLQALGNAGIGTAANAFNKIGRAVSGVTGGIVDINTQDVIQRGLAGRGLAINPFLALMFQSPHFRQFQFQWLLAPKNEEESNTLAQIVNAFKNHMLPDEVLDENFALLKYPDVVQPTIIPNFGFHFKQCVIENINVDYAPGGQPSFFKDNKPTMVRIVLQLHEIEFWLKGQY